MKNFRFRGTAGIGGSTDFHHVAQIGIGQSKNSALVTDMDTTSGIVIPLENLR